MRWWKGSTGGATYTVCAPDSVAAMLFILRDERLTGNTDIDELSVEELTHERLWKATFRDEDGVSQPLVMLPTGAVCCSEWP